MKKDMENHSFGHLHPLRANHATRCWDRMRNKTHAGPSLELEDLGICERAGSAPSPLPWDSVVLRSPLKDKLKELLIIL